MLYRLPELVAADKSATVFLVEGEKKVDALMNWGFLATCNVCGSGAKWLRTYSNALRGRHVVILPDNDPIDVKTGGCPGKDWAVKILRALEGIAASVRIPWPWNPN